MNTPTAAQVRAIGAAVSALQIHGSACGHVRRIPSADCAYCDDARIADKAAAALASIRS